jgi:hypothetical protein
MHKYLWMPYKLLTKSRQRRKDRQEMRTSMVSTAIVTLFWAVVRRLSGFGRRPKRFYLLSASAPILFCSRPSFFSVLIVPDTVHSIPGYQVKPYKKEAGRFGILEIALWLEVVMVRLCYKIKEEMIVSKNWLIHDWFARAHVRTKRRLTDDRQSRY